MITMSMSRRMALAFAGLLATTGLGAAQDYPARPVTFIVPFAAGGGVDSIMRRLSDELQKALGQPIIIEPRPGANGAIGSTAAARATPDGYTLLATASSTYSLNPNLMKAPPYDQLKDLVPVATIGRSPWLLVVPTDSPFKSVADVVNFGRANPGKLAFPFWQSSVLVTGETFGRVAGLQLRKVPYKGAVESTTDLLAGRLPIMFADTIGARPQLAAGKIRVLASTTEKRPSLFPDAPTLKEAGYDVVTDSMTAIFAPAGTPKPILERLSKEFTRIVSTNEDIRGKLRDFGLDPTTMTLAEFDAFVRSELTRWAEMIEKTGLQKN
jgi:tripartite-type tricarboxylate transporter receptor subunit TctC